MDEGDAVDHEGSDAGAHDSGPGAAPAEGATLHPKLYLRNVTTHAVEVKLQFNWRNDQHHGTSAGPTLALAPLSTQLVDVAALQAQGAIPDDATWASVFIAAGQKPDEIMAVAASFSDTSFYGAQTPFNDQLAFQWAGGMWQVDALHDSITTVGNGGDAATKARFLVYYDMPGAKGSQVPYELDQTIQPGEHMWVNIGDLIRRQVPDVNGKVLPATLTSGTYEFKDMTNRAHGSLFEGKVIVDKTNGHATYGCAECCGHNQGLMQPWSILLGFSANGSILDQNSCETFPEDITGLFSVWNSANTGIATVDNVGLGQGIGVGSAAIRAEAFAVEKDLGGADMLHCPTGTLLSNGPANVAPTITGPNTVWNFGGQTPGGYATSITLTSSASGTWAVQQSASIVSLSTTTGSSITVTSTGTASSQSVGDVKITVTVSGIASAPFAVTARKPSRLVAGTIVNSCDPTFGYSDFINYIIQDQLLTPMPSAVPINEHWTSGVVQDDTNPVPNWRQGVQGAITTTGSTFADHIGGENLSLPPVPVPTCNASDGTAIDHWGQDWLIGSTQIGVGVRVQSDTLQKYIGHALHTSIISPAP